MFKRLLVLFGVGLALAVTVFAQTAALIQPEDVVYLGAFRPPQDAPDDIGWLYDGEGLAFYPNGDPTGPDDGYPGSLYGIGHNWNQFVSEISIPAPAVADSIEQLPFATTLQPFVNLRGDVFPEFAEMEIPIGALAYLPAQGDQSSDKLYFAWAPWLPEEDYRPSFGWAELNLSNPQPAGVWSIDGYTRYETVDYLLPIDPAWAAIYTPGKVLATGRFREGGQLGAGPTLFAIAPWEQGNPPPAGAALESVKLLQYAPYNGPDEQKLVNYSDADQWSGAAWLTAGDKSAVVFVGSKGLGKTWYGFANGVVWEEPYPEVPEWPFDQRGFWSDDFEAQILFYDPADLGAVARGEMETWEPQPYAMLNIDPYLFDTDDDPFQKVRRVGAAAFDRDNGLLYIMETRAYEDAYSVIHVFRVQ